MRDFLLLLVLLVAACAGDSSDPIDAAAPDSELELELDAAAPDAATDRPDAEPLPLCADVADQCASMQWSCPVCGVGDEVCTCVGSDPTLVCREACP